MFAREGDEDAKCAVMPNAQRMGVGQISIFKVAVEQILLSFGKEYLRALPMTDKRKTGIQSENESIYMKEQRRHECARHDRANTHGREAHSRGNFFEGTTGSGCPSCSKHSFRDSSQTVQSILSLSMTFKSLSVPSILKEDRRPCPSFPIIFPSSEILTRFKFFVSHY